MNNQDNSRLAEILSRVDRIIESGSYLNTVLDDNCGICGEEFTKFKELAEKREETNQELIKRLLKLADPPESTADKLKALTDSLVALGLPSEYVQTIMQETAAQIFGKSAE